MKKRNKKIITIIFTFVFMISLVVYNISAQEIPPPKTPPQNYDEAINFIDAKVEVLNNADRRRFSMEYSYPIVPGMLEWEQLETHAEMMEVCQIPEYILKNMTTEKLAETVVKHPLLSSIMIAYENVEQGFSHFAEDFNGASELLKRSDAEIYIAKIYADTLVPNEDVFQEKLLLKECENVNPIVDLYTKEAILATPQIFNLFEENESVAIAIIANEKMIEKNVYKYQNGATGLTYEQRKATACHEYGHFWGLAHTNSNTSNIMCQLGSGRKATIPSSGDIAGIKAIYGK